MSLLLLIFLMTFAFYATGVRSRLHRNPPTAMATKQLSPASPPLSMIENRLDWPEYMIEFRGIKRDFRFEELLDNIQYVLLAQQHYTDKDISTTFEGIKSSFQTVILEKERSGLAIFGSLSVPHGDILIDAVNRCSTVRSLIQVWGKGKTTEQANSDALTRLESTIRQSFPIPSSDKNSWRMNFRKYGRSKGLTNSEKVTLLRKFNTILQSLGGEVDLLHAQHDLIYIEDWSTYHWDVTMGTIQSSQYVPALCIIGEILAEPKAIEDSFNIKRRPFLGTTTMAAVSAHLTASASLAGPNGLVLDPFCGTGSLLLNCAFLGATVLGSDYDCECLGLPHFTEQSNDDGDNGDNGDSIYSKKDRILKNVNFYRPSYNQSNKSTYDNFVYYSLEDRVLALLGCDAKRWLGLSQFDLKHVKNRKQEDDYSTDGSIPVCLYSKSESFDSDIVQRNFLHAIVTDPPYGRREKAQETRGVIEESDTLAFATSKHMGNPREITSLLFTIARRLIRTGGRLVFWYPSEANLDKYRIINELNEIEARSRCEEDTYELSLVRVTADKLHDRMWRWLIIYEVYEAV